MKGGHAGRPISYWVLEAFKLNSEAVTAYEILKLLPYEVSMPALRMCLNRLVMNGEIESTEEDDPKRYRLVTYDATKSTYNLARNKVRDAERTRYGKTVEFDTETLQLIMMSEDDGMTVASLSAATALPMSSLYGSLYRLKKDKLIRTKRIHDHRIVYVAC